MSRIYVEEDMHRLVMNVFEAEPLSFSGNVPEGPKQIDAMIHRIASILQVTHDLEHHSIRNIAEHTSIDMVTKHHSRAAADWCL